jgi:hypothetical protein
VQPKAQVILLNSLSISGDLIIYFYFSLTIGLVKDVEVKNKEVAIERMRKAWDDN